MDEKALELNFDGLVGPTHNYAGLSHGNLASTRHGQTVSNPRDAALEGLAKMKRLADMGVPQAVLPPHERPDLNQLRRMGFSGLDRDVIESAARDAPQLLVACTSASSMWVANAATVCPSVDAEDGRVHFTAANLINELHRCIEPATTSLILNRIFADDAHFVHHEPLPPAVHLRDEGAANHTRLCAAHGETGIQMFVYGAASNRAGPCPKRYPARQSYEASAAVARLHRIDPERALFVQQHPDAIDSGVFHNDVICVGHRNILFYHTQAFVDTPQVIDQVCRRFQDVCGAELIRLEVDPRQVTLDDAVETYLFNSQIVTLPDGSTILLCPQECRGHECVGHYLEEMAEQGPFGAVEFVDVRQSMKNGGGPACLRLRVVLSDAERARMHHGVVLTDALHDRLVSWVQRHYRDRLHVDDLADPKLAEESRSALDDLTGILGLRGIYSFQRSQE